MKKNFTSTKGSTYVISTKGRTHVISTKERTHVISTKGSTHVISTKGRNLIIDIGNSLIKAAIFIGDGLAVLWTGELVDEHVLNALIEEHRPAAAIISSVRALPVQHVGSAPVLPPELQFLAGHDFPVLVAGHHLELPVTLRYDTPDTLGTDRLAAAIAAAARFPGEHSAVVNAGSCLTIEFVNDKNEYLGGTIAPGLMMRLKAMHHFTGRLPLVDQLPGDVGMIGNTTKNAMLSGAINGMSAEIDGIISQRQKEIGFFNVILSGGDGKIFVKKLKSSIFAVENIVLQGLNLMLKHNVQHLIQ
jgi:type III pantothenate kinase